MEDPHLAAKSKEQPKKNLQSTVQPKQQPVQTENVQSTAWSLFDALKPEQQYPQSWPVSEYTKQSQHSKVSSV